MRVRSEAIALVSQLVERKPGTPEASNMFLRNSEDEGRSWSKPVQINLPNLTASPYHNTLTQLDSGRLLLPVRPSFSSTMPPRPTGERTSCCECLEEVLLAWTFGARTEKRKTSSKVRFMVGRPNVFERKTCVCYPL